MTLPDNKTVPITVEAHERLLELRNLMELRDKKYHLSLKETASRVILETPLPHNGHNQQEEVKEESK